MRAAHQSQGQSSQRGLFPGILLVDWMLNHFLTSGCEQYKELAEGQLPQADDAAEGEEGDGGPVQEGPEAVGQALGESGQVQGERDLDILPVLTILVAEQLSHGLQERKDCC